MPLEPFTYNKNWPMKRLMEDLFGSDAWYKLKEAQSFSTWRPYLIKLLKSYLIAINESVQIYDEEWLSEVAKINIHGQESIQKSSDFDEAIGILAATLARQSFLQIGDVPMRPSGRKTGFGLQKKYWKLDGERSVIYVQSASQKQAKFERCLISEIGFEKFLDISIQHRSSGTRETLADWFEKQAK